MKKNFTTFFRKDFTSYYPLLFTIVFVAILLQYKFPQIEAVFYDQRAKYDIGIPYKDNIVLVTLDEESDEFLGESYPYTYSTYVKLVKRLVSESPKVVNIFGDMSEPITVKEESSIKEFKKILIDYKNSGGVFRFATYVDSWGESLPPNYLRDLGFSPAIINIDRQKFAKDKVTRRAVLNVSGEETLHFWTANEYRILKGLKPLLLKDISGAYYVREADASFSLFRYYTSPIEDKGHLKSVSAHKVVVGNFPRDFFKDKIVLIGPTYLSNMSDYVLTPFNKEEARSPKLRVHANIIQSLIENKTVQQVPFWVTGILCLIVSIFLSVIISRIQPAKGLVITVMTIMSMILLSYLLFIIFGLWLYVTHLLLTIFVVYYIWVPFRAIGEYQRRYAIQEEAKLLKRVEDLKQNFISLMSHDLKTPVAKIAGVADILIQKHGRESSAGLTEGLRTIIDSTKELNNFITSILDLTKVESRKFTLNMVSKDINKLIEDIVHGLEYEAKRKNVDIQTELGPLFPIRLDVTLMTRVVHNLVENAIKYSGEQTCVEVKTWDDEDWVYIEIKDNGVGIPEDDLKNIFEKFYRVKNDASHKIKGSGLGLYLVKYFVELHGGTITAESVLSEGTTFIVQLPNK
jgi:signal transduction histidine kinase